MLIDKNKFFVATLFFLSAIVSIDNANAMGWMKNKWASFKGSSFYKSANSFDERTERRKQTILQTLDNLITRFDNSYVRP